MHRYRLRSIARSALALLLAPALAVPAADNAPLPDWPQFRGPTGQGIAEDAAPPLEWGPDKNIAWRQPIPGTGWSSPVLYENTVYLTSALLDGNEDPESLRALAVDAATGTIEWSVEVFPAPERPAKHPKNGFASPTPIAADGRIYVHFGPWGTACLDTEGQVRWRQTGLSYPTPHGNGGSPVLHGGKLIFSCDSETDPFVVALDATTGELAWKTPRNTTASKKFSFCTPALLQDGPRTLAVSPGSGFVGAYAIENGREVWRVHYGEGFSIVPRPVIHNGLVYVATGFARPSNVLAIRTGGEGDVTDTHIAWTSEEGTPHTPSMLAVGEELYFLSDRGTLTCADAATGSVHWREDLGGRYSASLVYANGKIYATDEEGATRVVAAGKTFALLGQNDLNEPTLASLAIVDKTIFLRTASHLYRIESPS